MDEQWKWRPELGRWRLLEHGYPSAPQAIAVSTDGIAAHDAYHYWRDLAFSDFEPEAASREHNRSFRAKANGLCWERADFFTTASGALAGGRTRRHIAADGLDSISIGLVLEGERRSEQEGDAQAVVRPGGLFVYDAAHPNSVAWSRHNAIYLVVRRPDALGVLGDMPTPTTMMQRLARSRLRHALADQFRMLARNMGQLSPNEQAFVLDQTIQMSLFALANAGGAEAEPAGPVLNHVALRHIETHLADPGLDAAQLARALGCSRATLYRAFAAQDTGVAEIIRDMRLDRARTLLATAPPEATIGDIAMRCGLQDPTNFARQFRRRFGMSPSELRQRR